MPLQKEGLNRSFIFMRHTGGLFDKKKFIDKVLQYAKN